MSITRVKIILLPFFVSIFLTSCLFVTEEPYKFRQEFDQIASIDILRKEYDSIDAFTPMDVVKTLDESDYRACVDALLSADGGRVGLEPGSGFGFYIIRITYQDGEIEMIGNDNNGYITVDGRLREDCYSFNMEQFYKIISRFIGEEVVSPTLS